MVEDEYGMNIWGEHRQPRHAENTGLLTTQQMPFSTVCNSLPPSYTSRVVSDYAALVPDIICQRGRHPSAPQDLGPAVLPGLTGALPGHTGHAQDPGFYLTLLILPYLFCNSCYFSSSQLLSELWAVTCFFLKTFFFQQLMLTNYHSDYSH